MRDCAVQCGRDPGHTKGIGCGSGELFVKDADAKAAGKRRGDGANVLRF